MLSAASLAIEKVRSIPWSRGVTVSFIIHLCVLVGIPLLLELTRSTVRFERPPTFQLVTAPPSLKPMTPAAQKRLSKQIPPAERKKRSSRPVPNQGGAQEENVEELASLLEELPSPASISAVGNFKYNWYLAQVQEKVERNWNPASGGRSDSVVIAFTINADGSISDPQISRESSIPALNELALRAVRMAAPFSKLPPGVAENKYDMLCTLRPTRK